MKKLLSVLLTLTLLLSFAGAQTASAAQQDRASDILDKITKVDLLNQLLPLLLTKEQIKKILPAIEKAREQVRMAQAKEFEEMKKLEPAIDKALKEALENGEVVKAEVMKEATGTLKRLASARQFIAASNTASVLEVFKSVANSGQVKTAINSLDPRFFAPGTKIEELSDDTRLQVYVQEFLLHPFTYELLRKMSL